MQASYEVSLHGSFSGADLEPILQRITLQASSSKAINWKEITFDPISKPSQSAVSALGNDAARKEQVRLVCRKDLNAPRGREAKWILYAHSKKPEPARNETTVRQASYMQIVAGDALGFVSGLGYQCVFACLKRGYEFERDHLNIQVFKIDTIDMNTREITEATSDSPWQIEVKSLPSSRKSGSALGSTPSPITSTTGGSASPAASSSSDIPLKEQTAAILEFKAILKGLLDLKSHVPSPIESLR